MPEYDHAGMQALTRAAEEGKPHARVDAMFPLAETAKARAQGETGRRTGRSSWSCADRGQSHAGDGQNVSTGLMVLPALMSRTAWSMSANG